MYISKPRFLHCMMFSVGSNDPRVQTVLTTQNYADGKLWLFKGIDSICISILIAIANITALVASVQFSSVAQSCPALCDLMIAVREASLSITNSQSSLRLASIESVMPSIHLILGRLLLLLPPIPPSIRVFSNESTLRMRWPIGY